ncbi:helix-turn-helix domain-containing protein [Streptomyces sp. SID13666]|uniref:helix-turn-helix domain-containing protein n=1 Tax=unclassified Streptomyces TaxID=2593676 RepID=UPI0013C20C98|nr:MULTISPECIES: helix-turn-helix domain-containing protein [unclassified Streptomyces]NEA58297.1 helix-turn-helix domain-containing protein [Streptomyces sp. SID13666]NEA76575.1 helix-turn-helix domain-containing protein [Streptomyces sp. SID13588]
MMLSTSTLETLGGATGSPQPPLRHEKVCRMPMGLDIVITDEAPAQLLQEKRPHPERGAPGGSRGPQRFIARDSGDYLFVGVRGGGGAPFVQDAADIFLGPGDLCFYDAHHPPTLDFPEHFRAKVFLVPRELLRLKESDVHQLAGSPVTRASWLGTLLSPLLSDLADTASAAQPPLGAKLAWHAVNLLATLATEQLVSDATVTPDAQSPLVPRILEFIDLHLADTDLSPEVIAKAHHISVRYLHKLFENEGRTVGQWIRRRRLEQCRRDLTLRARRNRTIAAVAGRWGFTSATHFSRVFRAAYGVSPREWRDTALCGTQVDHG